MKKIVDEKFVEKVLRRFFDENGKEFPNWLGKSGKFVKTKEYFCKMKDFAKLIEMTIEQWENKK